MSADNIQLRQLDNIIAYLACEYHDYFKRWPYQTWLYKVLALLDFRCLHQFGRPATCLTYFAYPMGPVPEKLYLHKQDAKLTKSQLVNVSDNKYIVKAQEPDLDSIPGMYIDLIDNLCDECLQENVSLNAMIEKTHEEIYIWRETWEQAKAINPNNPPHLELSYKQEMKHIDSPLAHEAFDFYEGCKALHSLQPVS